MSTDSPIAVPPLVLDELRRIVGAEGVIAGAHELLVYECDAYTMEKHLPGAVVLPRNTEEVVAVVKLCAQHRLPIIPRGAGTSLSGTVLAVTGGVMIALTRMTRLIDIDFANRRALVEAGCVNAWVTNAVKSRGLYFAPDPSSQSACTIGGNVATNSGGPHTLKYGVTTNHVPRLRTGSARREPGLAGQHGRWRGGRGRSRSARGGDWQRRHVRRGHARSASPCPGPAGVQDDAGRVRTVDAASQTVSDIIAAGIVPGALEKMDQLITQAVEAAYHFGFPLDAGRRAHRGTGRPERRPGNAGATRDRDLPEKTRRGKSAWRVPNRNGPTFGNAGSARSAPSAGSAPITSRRTASFHVRSCPA
jgi:glycolate oxidase